MKEYISTFSITTHTGREILPEKVLIDGFVIEQLTRMKADRRLLKLADQTEFVSDLYPIFNDQRYIRIFSSKQIQEEIINNLKNIYLPYCEYETIEYFKYKDSYTYRHLIAVYCLSTYICSLLKSNYDPLQTFTGSLSHDIGKCTIPLEVLCKETPLTKNEKKYIEHHSLAGYLLLIYFTGDPNCMPSIIARDHHENKIGTGYPIGKTDISLQTEIVIACDIYDALLSPRPYRNETFQNRVALEELTKKCVEGQISEEILKVLIACNRNEKKKWNECKISTDYRGTYPKENNYGTVVEDTEFGLSKN